jgi:hypothetical protein
MVAWVTGDVPKRYGARRILGWTAGNLPHWAATSSQNIDTGYTSTFTTSHIGFAFSPNGQKGIAGFSAGTAKGSCSFYTNFLLP